MLNEQQKKDIYDLLLQNFKLEIETPLASIALYLKDKNFDYSEFGYKKLLLLLRSLEFLEFNETETKDHKKNDLVIIHEFKVKEEKKETKKEFTKEEQEKIAQILFKKFNHSSKYPLSMVSAYLSEAHVSYKEYGFSKMKAFLSTMSDYLSIHELNDKNGSAEVIFKEEKKKKKEEPVKASKKETRKKEPEPAESKADNAMEAPEKKAPESNTPKKKKEEPAKTTKKEQKKKEPEYPDLNSKNVELPTNLVLSMRDYINLGLSEESMLELILKDYEKAKKGKWIANKDDAMVFPLAIKTVDGSDLIASIKKAGSKAKFDYYVNFLGSDKEKPGDMLKDHVYFSSFDKAIEELASLAKEEPWCYKHSSDKYIILKIYLQYTFYRILTQKKLIVDEKSGYAIFNSGLKNAQYEDIYCILTKNQDRKIKEEYIFQGSATAASQGLGKIVIEHFNPLPQPALYADKAEDLILNIQAEIHTDYRHIILDNIDRFPLSFLLGMTSNFPTEKKIVASIAKEKDERTKGKLYQKLEAAIEKNDSLFMILRFSMESIIKNSMSMIKYDYRMALPSFFPTRDVMSMMMPLEFSQGEGVKAVLLIEMTPSGNYQGQTILTLKQCYVNARLIGRLDHSFLSAKEIED